MIKDQPEEQPNHIQYRHADLFGDIGLPELLTGAVFKKQSQTQTGTTVIVFKTCNYTVLQNDAYNPELEMGVKSTASKMPIVIHC